MAEVLLMLAWEATRFDPHSPAWCPEVHRWTDIRPRDMSWGYVIDPAAPPARQHIQAGDWVVRFADGHVRVLTPDQFEALSAPEPGAMRSMLEIP